jgi:hypothetical protein
MKQSKLRRIYASVSIDSSTFVNKLYVHCLCYQWTANTTTCIFSDCGSVMSLKGYCALKCVGTSSICGNCSYRREISKFRVEISTNVLLREFFCFFFTAMTTKISNHLLLSVHTFQTIVLPSTSGPQTWYTRLYCVTFLKTAVFTAW